MKDKAINIIIISGAIFVSFYFGGIKGVQKERNSNICVSPYDINHCEKANRVVEAVYKEVISTFSDDLREANERTKEWRDRYYSYKRQSKEIAKKRE